MDSHPSKVSADGSDPDAKDRLIRARLNENLPEISSVNASFEKVLSFLADSMGINICVDWNSLLTVGADQYTPVTLTLRQVRMGKVLQMVLEQAGRGFIGYIVDEGVVMVASLEGLSDPKYAVTRRFDVRVLLAARPAERGYDESVKQLVDAITTAIAPLSWLQNGGRTGSIHEFNGYMIVRQTLDVQLTINDLLNSMKTTATPKSPNSSPPPAISDLPDFDHETPDMRKKYWDAPPEFEAASRRWPNAWRLLGFLNDAMGRLKQVSHMPRITKSNAALDPVWAEGWLKFAAESRSIILLGSMEMHRILNGAFAELSMSDNGAMYQKIFLLLGELGAISEINQAGTLKINNAGYAKLGNQAEAAWKEVRARWLYLCSNEKRTEPPPAQEQANPIDPNVKPAAIESPSGEWIKTKDALALLEAALGPQGADLRDRQMRQRLDNLCKDWPKPLRPHGKLDRHRFQKELDAVKATIGKPKARKTDKDPTPEELEERRKTEKQKKLREKLDAEFPDDSAEFA